MREWTTDTTVLFELSAWSTCGKCLELEDSRARTDEQLIKSMVGMK
jgi:hypothetical protein